jgi:hypothetical protein
MKNSLIVRIAEGLGNQMFMYANAFNLSKKINYQLFLDNESAYFKKKDIRNFHLDLFNISAQIADNNYKFNNTFKNIKRKILIKLDKISKQKKFIIEKKFDKKKTKFEEINTSNLSKLIFLEGNYESEKYFNTNRNLLLNEFQIKDNEKLVKNKYHDFIIKNKERIISICVRTNRYSERINNNTNEISKSKSDIFTKQNIDYIYRAIKNFPKKIDNPIYLVWSNDFQDLKEYFPDKKFIFIENQHNKTIMDFHLFTLCQNFIVGPTSFHWWGAWLSQNNNKICIKPKNINQSSNIDFWPESWTPL